MAAFSGLRVSSNGGEASFFDAIAAQITPKVTDWFSNFIVMYVHIYDDDEFVQYY